ncbi:MAG TPA: ProQ/FinO family protein [Noviherbaspirillum sp.]|nr:ProQ/FinO family protein [Noviherbaspirillum sp.]
MTSADTNPLHAARSLLKQLEQSFDVFRNAVPLAVGIDKAVIARMPDVNRKVLRIALGLHTNSVRYLKAMEKAQCRFDLDGNPAGDVPEAHRTHASELLRERFKKAAEKRKEQALAEKQERQRAEKLRQLTEKFSSRH